MADYAHLETYIRELKKAAIDATMTVDWGMEGSTKAGSFEGIPNGILVANAPVGGWTVTYPAGTWTDNYTGEASAPPYDPATGAVNATQAWENVDIYVESALNRLRGIPEGTGSNFDDVIPALGAASAALSPGGAMLVGDGDKAEIGVGNESLQIYVGAIDDKLTNFSGHAIETLKTYYTNRIETTLTGQTAMAAMLAVLATGQAEIFDSARQDVADFVFDAKEAFIQLAQNHHAKKVQNTLKVVETAFSIAGLVTTGGLAKTVGKLSGIYGVINKWADKPEISTKEVVLGGSTAAARRQRC